MQGQGNRIQNKTQIRLLTNQYLVKDEALNLSNS